MTGLDARDLKILDLLQIDGRTPLKKLAEETGISVSSAQERVRRLVADGEIEAFTTKRRESTVRTDAYLLVSTQSRQCAQVAPHFVPISEILRCDSVAGEIDLVLTVRANSSERLQEVRDEVASMPGVTSATTLPTLVSCFAR